MVVHGGFFCPHVLLPTVVSCNSHLRFVTKLHIVYSTLPHLSSPSPWLGFINKYIHRQILVSNGIKGI
jgi:hypothetical protein